jgi:GNAT superfamily N-acetyltransferase
VVGSVAFSPTVEISTVGPCLIHSLVACLRNDPSVQRIESQFISFGLPWLSTWFQSHGFSTYHRVFLRRTLELLTSETPHDPDFSYERCSPGCLAEASRLMQEAHEDRVDAEMNELYRTREGCRVLLDNILHRRGCGEPIGSSSFLVRHGTGRVSGLVIATEISPRHAHLAQVAVSPAMQGRGLGRHLLGRAVSALAREGFRSVSLMVSQANRNAYSLYTSLGFQEVLDFPVFSWDSMSPATRSP